MKIDKKININASRNYNVIIGSNILKNAGELILPFLTGKCVVIISDDIVYDLYGDILTRALESQNIKTVHFIFKNGEKSKNINTLSEIYSFLALNHITRKDTIIALGGGVVGDIAGFAASSYLRAVNFINIPTTLLAMVDSSVGGKTAIDLPEGKNLVGSFYQPSAVICDTDTLETIGETNYKCGFGEIIKYALIRDKDLFYTLMNPDNYSISDIIARCVEIKRDIVELDEFEGNVRMILNFGHTLAHSIEKLSGYTGISHGEAVAVGMYQILRAQCGKNDGCVFSSEELEIIEKLFDIYSLPYESRFSIKNLCDNIIFDKKCEGDFVNLILLKSIGNAYIHKIKLDDCYGFFSNIK